jgi:uncharacterized membrane protein YgaE (UPF0421/DUF939 family)
MVPRRSHPYGAVQPEPVTVSHIAVGIWVATLLVLVLPSPKKHKPSEADLIRSYNVVLSTFPLVF